MSTISAGEYLRWPTGTIHEMSPNAATRADSRNEYRYHVFNAVEFEHGAASCSSDLRFFNFANRSARRAAAERSSTSLRISYGSFS